MNATIKQTTQNVSSRNEYKTVTITTHLGCKLLGFKVDRDNEKITLTTIWCSKSDTLPDQKAKNTRPQNFLLVTIGDKVPKNVRYPEMYHDKNGQAWILYELEGKITEKK